MKKAAAIFICAAMLIAVPMAQAAEYPIPDNPRAVPASVYEDPFQPDRFTTQYAPWLKNYHIMNENEYNDGVNGGEACQQIRDVSVSPINSDLMYFVTDTSGIYKTENGGKLWFNTNFNCPGYDGQGLLADKFDENIVWVSFRHCGVYRSRDGGKVWEHMISNTDTKNMVRSGMFAQDDVGNTYIAAGSGIYKHDRKTDELTNLTPQFASLTKTNSMRWRDLDITGDGQHIYATADGMTNTELIKGIYVSHDAGATWDIKYPGENQLFQCYTIALHPEEDNTIYFGALISDKETAKTAVPYALYVTQDDFATYKKLYNCTYENAEEGVKTTNKSFFKMKFGPKNADGIYPLYIDAHTSTYPLRISYDYGETFTGRVFEKKDKLKYDTWRYPARYYPNGYTGWMCQGYDIDMQRPGRVIFAAHGMWEKDEAGNITRLGAGFGGVSVVHIAFNSKNQMFASTMDVGAFMTKENLVSPEGYPFVTAVGGSDFDHYTMAVYDPNNDNHIVTFVGKANGASAFYGIRQSYDGGTTIEPLNPDTSMPKTPKYGNTTVLQYSKEDPNTIYSSYHTSHDNGKTWTQNEYNILAISPKNEKRMLARDGAKKDTKLYLTEDGGKTWNYLMTVDFTELKSVAFDLADDNYVWYARRLAFGKIDIENAKDIKYTSKVKFPAFEVIAQNPENPDHLIVTALPATNYNHIIERNFRAAESLDHGETWTTIPGLWGSHFHSVTFIPGTTQAFLCGKAGMFLYDYAKFKEFLDSKITVELNDKEISFSVMPEITNSRAMVPMRELFEMLGAEISWDDATQTVSAKRGAQKVALQIGSSTAAVNSKQVTLDAAPYIKNGRTMIPLRLVSEALGINVGWDSPSRRIIMKDHLN